MRLWSIHPAYLDTKGLVALWREGLLAQNVLLGNTRGYKNHPQLVRFRQTRNPVGAIASYLRCVVNEADKRGYHFDRDKIVNRRMNSQMPVTTGQVAYEFQHLLKKLKTRNPELFRRLSTTRKVNVHPSFRKVRGDIEDWEVV